MLKQNTPKTIYLLRGLGRHSQHWRDFPRLLEERLGIPCKGLDLPGTGSRVADKAPSSIAETARQTFASLDSKTAPYAVVGHSLGAMVAAEWHTQAPELVTHSILVNTSANLCSFHQRLRPVTAVHLLVAALWESRRERIVLRRNCNRFQEDVALAWEKIADENPVPLKTTFRQLQAARTWQLPTALRHLQLIFLTSDKDRLVNTVCSQRLASHLNKPLYTHPWAGHDISIDDPDWLIAAIGKGLGQTSHTALHHVT